MKKCVQPLLMFMMVVFLFCGNICSASAQEGGVHIISSSSDICNGDSSFYVSRVSAEEVSGMELQRVQYGDDKYQTIEVNVPVYGTLEGEDEFGVEDEDCFKFILPEPGIVNFALTRVNPTGETSCRLYSTTYGGDHEYGTIQIDTSLQNYTSRDIGMGSGEHSFCITGGIDGQYKLTVLFRASSTWEMEPNDTFNSGFAGYLKDNVREMMPGVVYRGFLCDYRDNDYFKIQIVQDSTVTITFNHDYVDSGEQLWSYFINNYDEEDVFYGVSGSDYEVGRVAGNSGTCKTVYVLPAGTYAIRLNNVEYGMYTGKFSDSEYRISYTFEPTTISYELDDVVMYRLYNPNSGEHFYTSNEAESAYLSDIGWKFEGIAWVAPSSSDIPVYRVYNPNSGEHHYTTNAGERDSLVAIGWNDEGIGWYSADKDGTPLYRLYNPNATGAQEAGAHHYTQDESERDYLASIGWNYEGIGWYGL